MKKIIFRTMAIVLVLGVAACSRTDETADTPSDQKITELGVIAQSTRSTLGDDNWVEWDANDSFSVFSSMSFSSEFTIKELLDEGHGAKLEGMTIPADTYYILRRSASSSARSTPFCANESTHRPETVRADFYGFRSPASCRR